MTWPAAPELLCGWQSSTPLSQLQAGARPDSTGKVQARRRLGCPRLAAGQPLRVRSFLESAASCEEQVELQCLACLQEVQQVLRSSHESVEERNSAEVACGCTRSAVAGIQHRLNSISPGPVRLRAPGGWLLASET